MEFVAIDVETANADMASICQIGLAKFVDGKLIDEWSSLIDPEDYFSGINIGIHGIQEEDVTGCPTFSDIYVQLDKFLNNQICVSHTSFDRTSIHRVASKYNLQPFDCYWLDSARVVRRVWEDCSRKGYGLANVSKRIGYEFKHHDALEDAKACGHVLIAAISESGINVEEWLVRSKQPISPSERSSRIKMDGDPEGEFYGEVLVFTGELEVPRKEAASLAAGVGCSVAAGVTKKTTLLVVGDQDVSKLAGHNKSSKHRKAEDLIMKGQPIRILKESDFIELVKVSS